MASFFIHRFHAKTYLETYQTSYWAIIWSDNIRNSNAIIDVTNVTSATNKLYFVFFIRNGINSRESQILNVIYK